MITALDIICIQNQIRFTDEDGNQINVRRNEETREIVSLRESGQFDNRRPFQWDAETDTFIQSLEDSHVLERVANENGWTPSDKREELEQREEVLEYMLENNIREFDYVTNIIQAYMVDSEKILTEIREGTLDPDNLKSLTDMEWESPEVDPDTTLNEQITETPPETQGDNK
jgi:flagellar protein FlaI